jgi:hypothetical protein
MNYTVFYSWQSDLENRFNRSFILDALEKAVTKISSSEAFSVEAVIDRDTYGIPGSPAIIESITSKITKSDIFVCDISIINYNSQSRPTPNPNVLYELGFASAILGWDRIVMVQNVAFGGLDTLPFDLKGRRILQYNVDETTEKKANEKNRLKEDLINTFFDAFKYYSNNNLNTREKIVWWGRWEASMKIKARGGHINISRVSSDAFFFDLSLYDGARTGQIEGKAQIITPHSAYARIKTSFEGDCEINFRRRLEGNTWHIDLEVGDPCKHFHGMGATFAGSYTHVTESVVNWGYLDELDLNEIARLTGKYLLAFLENFQQISAGEDNNDSTFKIITAGVKGLYTTMEAIVALSDQGNVWCAYLDYEAESVRFFTNSNGKRRPNAITEWLSRFEDRPLIVNQNGEEDESN